MDLEELLRKHWPTLKSRSTNYSEILTLLYAQGIISQEEKKKIKNPFLNATEFDIYDSLYEHIVRKNLDEEILKVILKKSSNEHIVNLIWDKTQNSSSAEVLDKIFWNVEARNVHFTGRKSILENLEKDLESRHWESSTLKFVLNGMGGIGKSWALNEFLHRNQEKIKNIFWFNSGIVDDLFEQIQKLLCKFEGEENNNLNPSQDLAHKRMKYWLEQGSNWPWILVFDNLETIQTIQNLIPQSGGICLITSRNNISWPVEFKKLQIYGFTKSESYDLMEKILKYRDETDFDGLINVLENLPLAISNACYFINDKRITIGEYLKPRMTEKKFLEILHCFDEKSIWTSFQISLCKIKNECPEAFEFLEICSFIIPGDSYNYIPARIFLEKFINYRNLNENEISAINRVFTGGYNFLKIVSINGSEVHSIHRLVRNILKFGVKNVEILKISYDIVLSLCSQPNCVEKPLFLKTIDNVFLNMIEFAYNIEKAENTDTSIPKLLDIIKLICKFINDILNYNGCRITDLGQILQKNFDKMERYVEGSFELCSTIAMCCITYVYWDSQISLRFFEKCFQIRKTRLGKNSANFENLYIFFEEHEDFNIGFLAYGFIHIFEKILKMIIDINGDNDCQLVSIYWTLGNLHGKFHAFRGESFMKSVDYFKKASTLIKKFKWRTFYIKSDKWFKNIEQIICNKITIEIVQPYVEDYMKILIQILIQIGEEDDDKIFKKFQNIAQKAQSVSEKHPEKNYYRKLAEYENKYSILSKNWKRLKITEEMGLCARALYDYQAEEDNELSFDPWDIITDIEKIDDGWWRGKNSSTNMFGLFPSNFVELIN